MKTLMKNPRISSILAGVALATLGVGFATNSFFFGLIGPQADGTGITPVARRHTH